MKYFRDLIGCDFYSSRCKTFRAWKTFAGGSRKHSENEKSFSIKVHLKSQIRFLFGFLSSLESRFRKQCSREFSPFPWKLNINYHRLFSIFALATNSTSPFVTFKWKKRNFLQFSIKRSIVLGRLTEWCWKSRPLVLIRRSWMSLRTASARERILTQVAIALIEWLPLYSPLMTWLGWFSFSS